MIAGRIPRPASKPIKSNVNRGNPEYWSIPIVDIKSPRAPDRSPLNTEPNETDAIAVNPSIATKKYSAGPNNNATFANDGARTSNTTPLIIPPTTEAKVDILMACIALPRLVISYPSIADAAEAEVPGARSKMAENEPP